MVQLTPKDIVYRKWADSKAGGRALINIEATAKELGVKATTIRQWINWWERGANGDPYFVKSGRNMSVPPRLSREYRLSFGQGGLAEPTGKLRASGRLKFDEDTLLVIPCSGSKSPSGDFPLDSSSILTAITPALASELAVARGRLRATALLDERALSPAYLRYSGELYKYASEPIRKSLDAERRILIVSGGYGIIVANESIGMYERRFHLADWPKHILERCILDFASRQGIKSVIAVMSKSTDYANLIRRIDWRRARVDARLVSPVSDGGGAQTKVPRAQGQFIAALVNDKLSENWMSSDKLAINVEFL